MHAWNQQQHWAGLVCTGGRTDKLSLPVTGCHLKDSQTLNPLIEHKTEAKKQFRTEKIAQYAYMTCKLKYFSHITIQKARC